MLNRFLTNELEEESLLFLSLLKRNIFSFSTLSYGETKRDPSGKIGEQNLWEKCKEVLDFGFFLIFKSCEEKIKGYKNALKLMMDSDQ